MNEHVCPGLEGDEPLGFMAALGALRVLTRSNPTARLSWVERGTYVAVLHMDTDDDPVDLLLADLERWRGGHAAIDFAKGAERKTQDLKAPPAVFRELMRSVQCDPEGAAFVSSFATGVAIDGTGQTKPTSLHFCSGNQNFMVAVLDLVNQVNRNDVVEALYGPWLGRHGIKDLSWRSASDRNRALLSYDPGSDRAKSEKTSVPGATWLAFQSLPLWSAAPVGRHITTTGFTGRGKQQQLTWPVWAAKLSLDEVTTLVGTHELRRRPVLWRAARGISAVFECAVVRRGKGYGSFAASRPV